VLEVTKTHLLAAISGCLLAAGLAVFTAVAQTGPARGATAPQGAAPRVAMLDVSYIFKNHTGFKAQTAQMRAQVDQAKARMKGEEEALTKMIQALKNMQPGSAEYKQLEEQTARRRADAQIQLQLQNKEFMVKEANIYHDIYQEIEADVAYFAQQNGIDAVLRFNGDPVEKDQPNQILRNVNKQVVWFSQGLDITPNILDRLNKRYGQNPGAIHSS
jgi:Skp family chaperone for outer membrane proteins